MICQVVLFSTYSQASDALSRSSPRTLFSLAEKRSYERLHRRATHSARLYRRAGSTHSGSGSADFRDILAAAEKALAKSPSHQQTTSRPSAPRAQRAASQSRSASPSHSGFSRYLEDALSSPSRADKGKAPASPSHSRASSGFSKYLAAADAAALHNPDADVTSKALSAPASPAHSRASSGFSKYLAAAEAAARFNPDAEVTSKAPSVPASPAHSRASSGFSKYLAAAEAAARFNPDAEATSKAPPQDQGLAAKKRRRPPASGVARGPGPKAKDDKQSSAKVDTEGKPAQAPARRYMKPAGWVPPNKGLKWAPPGVEPGPGQMRRPEGWQPHNKGKTRAAAGAEPGPNEFRAPSLDGPAPRPKRGRNRTEQKEKKRKPAAGVT